jgi:hypothetical protein
MTEFEDFTAVAIKMGTERPLSVFVPEGNFQDVLFKNAIKYLKGIGFRTMDVTSGAYEDAVESFHLAWPILLEKWQGSEEFEVEIEENENKLLIICGKESNRLFWKYLCEESLLYTGGALLPPTKDLSPSCIVVPDLACVAAIIRHRHFYDNYPLEFFGPIGIFSSNTVPFNI